MTLKNKKCVVCGQPAEVNLFSSHQLPVCLVHRDLAVSLMIEWLKREAKV